MRNQLGQSLIELMVSVVIITVALSGIIAIFPYIIEKNVRIKMQNDAINLATSELERLRALSYYDKELDALEFPLGMVTIKQTDKFLIRTIIKYVEPKTGLTPESYPSDILEDTGLKEITVSVKRKDSSSFQANLITYFSKAKSSKS